MGLCGNDDDHSALLFFNHRDLWKLSDQLNDGKPVFCGTGMPDMSDSAWLAIRPKPKLTQKSESTVDAKSVELSQKDVDFSFFGHSEFLFG